MAERGVDVEFRDINKTPPARALLERHLGAGDFTDYLSRRSPVFKTRPLPGTKRDAIELMLEQPNLIRRPVLVTGSTVIFGFDKNEYDRLGKDSTGR